MEDLISIVIPCYNRENIILDALNSVLNQTYKNIEVIIVDDASTDNTYKLFEKFGDNRVRYYRYEKNQGACYARNYGVERAQGKYIAFQDSDDIWHFDKLEKQCNDIIQSNADFVYCGMNRVDKQNTKSFYYPQNDFKGSDAVLEQLLVDNMISTQTILMKREVSEKIQFDVTFRRYQDWDYAIQAAKAGINMYYRKEALVDSEIQTNSISATVKSGEAYEHLVSKYQDLYNSKPYEAAKMYNKIGNAYKNIDVQKAKQYYYRSLKCKFSIKVMVKYIMSILHLRKLIGNK